MSKTKIKEETALEAPEVESATLPEPEAGPETVSQNSAPDAVKGSFQGAAPDISPDAAVKDVDELITGHGLPAWQGAALCRAMSWAPGKMVTEADFSAALEQLKNRRMGG